MYKEVSEISMPEYPGFVRVISLSVKEDTLVRIEYNIEFSNEVGYIYEKKFSDINSATHFIDVDIKSSEDFKEKETTLEESHLNLLKDLVEGKIKYLEGFSSRTSIEELKENYNYILHCNK